jgi:hypothetical protein
MRTVTDRTTTAANPCHESTILACKASARLSVATIFLCERRSYFPLLFVMQQFLNAVSLALPQGCCRSKFSPSAMQPALIGKNRIKDTEQYKKTNLLR